MAPVPRCGPITPRASVRIVIQGHPEQLLAPILARADDHEQARVLGFEAGPEIDAVGPQVGEGALDRPAAEGAVIGLPVGLEGAGSSSPTRVAFSPSSWRKAGSKSPLEKPSRYSRANRRWVSWLR